MMQQEQIQEQVLFTDDSVYISDTRLVLRKGGTYPITNLSQVTFGRLAASHSWIGFLIFGLIFLALGPLLSQSSALVGYSMPNGEPYLVIIGSSLLLISLLSVASQVRYPLYVVVLNGTARPIRSRNRLYIMKLVEVLNEAISKRDRRVVGPHIDNVFQDFSHRSSNDIIVSGEGQVSIATSGNASNVKQAPDTSWPIFSPHALNQSSLNTLSKTAQADLRTGMLDNNRVTGGTDQPGIRLARPADQPVQAGTRARKIIISYSHEDHQWLDLLRTHLALLERQQMIALWDDTQIEVGMHTRQAMTDALKAADFALLLVSANFLASDVIMHYELPQILQRHFQGQFTLLPLVLSPCLYNESPLGEYRPFNLNNPLSILSHTERDDVLVGVAREIQKEVSRG